MIFGVFGQGCWDKHELLQPSICTKHNAHGKEKLMVGEMSNLCHTLPGCSSELQTKFFFIY
jgi:hypothetical protein